MTPVKSLDDTARRLLLYAAVIGSIFAVATSWVTTNYQLEGKADKHAVQLMEQKVDALLIFACRNPANVSDTRCSGVAK